MKPLGIKITVEIYGEHEKDILLTNKFLLGFYTEKFSDSNIQEVCYQVAKRMDLANKLNERGEFDSIRTK